VRLVIAGTGPDGEELRTRLPKAIYLGWVDQETLSRVYASSEMLILPSKFDTFNCAVLEAMTCGLLATAYRSKGPKDLITDGKNGYLAKTFEEMEEKLAHYISNQSLWKNFKAKCIEISGRFNKEIILDKLLSHVGIEN
jgi:glycosyltransferase involved in cell wall biosynthesis